MAVIFEAIRDATADGITKWTGIVVGVAAAAAAVTRGVVFVWETSRKLGRMADRILGDTAAGIPPLDQRFDRMETLVAELGVRLAVHAEDSRAHPWVVRPKKGDSNDDSSADAGRGSGS